MNTRYTALSLAFVLLLAAVAPAAAATAPVGSDAVGDLTVTTAPATTSASAAAEAGSQSDPTNSIVAASDVVVLRLNASGVPAEADDDGTLLGDELEVSLQQTESSVGTDESAKTLDAAADTEGVAVDATENAVYVAVDLDETTFQQGNGTAAAEVGDSFTASATLTDAVTDGENYTRTATFGVVEPKVNFLDGVSEAPAGQVVNYQVATTLAPGTSLTFSLVSGTGDDTGAETTTQVTVNRNGRATGQFSFFTFEANEEYTISITSEEAGLNETWTGTAQATGTQTPTDTSTETTTSAPGFGVVAALIALIGVGFVARRE
ncbi:MULTISPECIES: PGF-CTERM sorting domain-containing protein [Halolamina]|uniref:PGF-CTERM protein n=1 Tax=Halolamina pelagica TaxID=699431 RepID=A0A1I5R0T3_9EURY|nr:MULTISPECIES: PGF-CTERM sorting domain-containing protein [Halolamina]NHX35631.1 PGF-CTERM sorting domain-containing protein [Halolamina sp. R1-12]SFP52093.1 PGF-CTERM protein [Halolamina pelagica]